MHTLMRLSGALEYELDEFQSHLNAESEHAGPEFPCDAGLDVQQSGGHQEHDQVESVAHVAESVQGREGGGGGD